MRTSKQHDAVRLTAGGGSGDREFGEGTMLQRDGPSERFLSAVALIPVIILNTNDHTYSVLLLRSKSPEAQVVETREADLEPTAGHNMRNHLATTTGIASLSTVTWNGIASAGFCPVVLEAKRKQKYIFTTLDYEWTHNKPKEQPNVISTKFDESGARHMKRGG